MSKSVPINLTAASRAVQLLKERPPEMGSELRACISALATLTFEEHREAWLQYEGQLPRWAAGYTVLFPDLCPNFNGEWGQNQCQGTCEKVH